MGEERVPLFEIFTQVLDNLGNLVNSLMDHATQGNESALKILYFIVKIFYVAN
jgi:hypothetical protein